MAKNPKRRQQKLERKAAKRKEKKKIVARQQPEGLTERLVSAENYPVLNAWITENVWSGGLGWALLSRALPNGTVAVGLFLIDRFCLGVKDAHAEVLHRVDYDEKYVREMNSRFPSHPVSPAKLRKFVEDAVAYAEDLGFHPGEDYEKASLLFGSIDPSECTEQFEFGKDGKPFFISGPYDSPARCRHVLAVLEDRCGPGGYDYLLKGDVLRQDEEGMLEDGG